MRSFRASIVPLFLLICLVATGLSARLPLLSNLSVEFSIVCSVPLFLAGLWLGGMAAHRTSAWPIADRFLAVMFPGSFLVLGVSLFPLLLGYAVSPDIRICSSGIPVIVYTFFAGGAALTGFYWAFASALFFSRPVSRGIFLTVLVVLVVAYSVSDMLWGARMTPLNPILGILLLYDVASNGVIPGVAWSHRAFYLALTVCVVALGIAARSRRPEERRVRTILVSFSVPILVVLLALALVRRDIDGFLPGTLRLSRYLSEKVESDHIRLFYRPGSYDAEDLFEALGILEWAYLKNAKVLPGSPGGKIHAYYYLPSQKRLLTGAEEVVFASPARASIHIAGVSSYELLRHELAHAMLASFGLPVIRLPLSLPMTEGLADAISKDYAVSPVAHSYIAGVLKNGDLPSAESFMTNIGFLKFHHRLGYAFSGSFLGFLIQKYGVRSVLASYGGKRLARAIGKPLAELDREWRAFLATIPVQPEEQRIARSIYNPRLTKPFYSTLCPRDRDRQKDRLEFLIESNRLDEAERLLRTYTAREPDDPEWRSFFVPIAMKRQQSREAERLLDQMENDGIPTSYLISGWTRLLRGYEQEWFDHPDSPEALANVKRALERLNALRSPDTDTLKYKVQIKILETSPDPSLYLAMDRFCGARSQQALLRWANKTDELALRILFVRCEPSAYSPDELRQLAQSIEKANQPGLMEAYREALHILISFWAQLDVGYEKIVDGYQLLIDVSPPSDREKYRTELEIVQFMHRWRAGSQEAADHYETRQKAS